VTETDSSCAEIALRLIGGEHASDDPELASHVGSCLRCFRTAAEMRELPQLSVLVREGTARVPDPGEAFWARFPSAVSAAWERRQRRENPLLAAWRLLTAWLRQPFAAALVGASVASLVLTVAGRPAAVRDVPIPEDDDATTAEMMTAPEVMGDDEAPPWELLELSEVQALAQVGDGNATLDDGDLASPAEEVELLESDELPMVAQAMRGRI
jgi:hypothetical protein